MNLKNRTAHFFMKAFGFRCSSSNECKKNEPHTFFYEKPKAFIKKSVRFGFLDSFLDSFLDEQNN